MPAPIMATRTASATTDYTGISATTGVRQKAMLSSSVLVQATNSGRIASENLVCESVNLEYG